MTVPTASQIQNRLPFDRPTIPVAGRLIAMIT